MKCDHPIYSWTLQQLWSYKLIQGVVIFSSSFIGFGLYLSKSFGRMFYYIEIIWRKSRLGCLRLSLQSLFGFYASHFLFFEAFVRWKTQAISFDRIMVCNKNFYPTPSLTPTCWIETVCVLDLRWSGHDLLWVSISDNIEAECFV